MVTQVIPLSRYQWPRVVELWNAQPQHQATARPQTRIAVGRSHAYMQQLEQAEQLIATLPAFETLEPIPQMMLLNLQGQIGSYRGNHLASLELNERLIALSRQYNSPLNTLNTLLNYVTECQALGLYERIRPALEEAKQLAVQLGDLLKYAVVQTRLASELVDAGEFERAETLLLEGLGLLQRHNLQHIHFLIESHLKLARLYLTWQPPHGVPLALKHARAALSQAQQNRDARFIASAMSYLVRAEVLVGNPRKALETAQQCLEFSQARNTNLGNAWYAYALALEANERLEEAREAIEQALKHRRDPSLEALFALERDRLSGNLKGVRERYESFVAQGFHGLASVALRYFPQLGEAVTIEPRQETHSVRLRLNVLGSVLIEQSGQPLRIRAKKRLEVLCYLLEARVAGRAEVDVLELVDVFYPDLPEDRAKLTLRQLIYLIRGDLGPESVQSTPSGYALGAVGSDLEQFLETGEAGLWRGAYLHGLSDGWNANVRDGLQLVLRSAAEELLSTDPDEATRLGEIWLEMEPYDLEALRLLLRALHHQGKPKAAERAYQQAQERFLEVGEALPEGLQDFLNTPTPS